MMITRSIRSLATVCTVAVVSLGSAACATGGANMSPAMQQNHMAMHYLATASHVAEIEEAQLALTKSQNAQVRSYAQMMISEHTTAMQRDQQMMAKMGMTPVMGMGSDMNRMRTALMENPYSRPLVEDHMRAMQMLQGVQAGMAFDRAYMQRQVNAHNLTLTNMDRMMAAMGHDMSRMTQGAMTSGSGNMGAGMSGTSSGNMAGHAGHTAGSANMQMSGNMSMAQWHMMERNMVAMHLQQAQQMVASMR